MGSAGVEHAVQGDPGARRFTRPPVVLVVDDESEIREALTEALEQEGYRVRIARNGEEALAQAHELPPDLILLDLMMPVMSGWQFLEARAHDAQLARIPVIVATASTGDLPQGAAAYLQKPFGLERLRITVGRHCDVDHTESTAVH
jgi:CheY-like chemotaxis protein